MKSLKEDLESGKLKKVYLLYGEEVYLKNLYKKKLKDAVLPSGDTMNLSAYEGKGIQIREVIERAETLPFFADRRLVLIENSGFFKAASPELAEYIPRMPEETCMVYVETPILALRNCHFRNVNLKIKLLNSVKILAELKIIPICSFVLPDAFPVKRDIPQLRKTHAACRAGNTECDSHYSQYRRYNQPDLC